MFRGSGSIAGWASVRSIRFPPSSGSGPEAPTPSICWRVTTGNNKNEQYKCRERCRKKNKHFSQVGVAMHPHMLSRLSREWSKQAQQYRDRHAHPLIGNMRRRSNDRWTTHALQGGLRLDRFDFRMVWYCGFDIACCCKSELSQAGPSMLLQVRARRFGLDRLNLFRFRHVSFLWVIEPPPCIEHQHQRQRRFR